MKLCLSIAPNSMRDAITTLKKYRHSSELMEVRIDGIRDLNLEQLLQQPRPKLIITNRRKTEGGKFSGSAKQQYKILSEAIQLEAEYIDVEFSWGTEFIKRLLPLSNKTKIICSYHNLKETPGNLKSLYNQMLKTGAQIIKLTTTANDITDNKIIFDLLEQSQKDKQKLIAHCMGEAGKISRIIGGKFGNYLTYAPITEENKTADGQITYDELKNLYRADQLNNRTKIFGLVGNPVSQSKGIYFHNKVFSRKHLNAVYINFLVNDLGIFLSTFKDIISGLSITMPFKEKITSFLDQADNHVSKLGVCNTVIKQKNKFIGYNTDLQAVISLLKKSTKLRGKKAVVLGTGATAKTMAFASMSNGCKTIIVGRDSEKAKMIATELNCEWTTLDNLNSLCPDLLMNGTSVGMKGNKQKRIVPKNFLRKDMIVFDAVYNPVMTPLLQDAAQVGCKIITGLELFEKQAKLQSKLFIDSIK